MKVLIYLRTSTQEQNPENQLKDCLSINKFGEHIVLQEQQSAFKDVNRVEFDKVLTSIKRRECEHLICWDLDRLFRNRQKLIDFFQLCKMYGCKVHSYRQQWLEELNSIQPPFDEIMHSLMLQIMGWLAEEESKKKGERVKASVRKKGDKTVSYKGNKWGRRMLTKQQQNKILELKGEGLSIRAISKQLGISIGGVHKYCKDFELEKQSNNDVHKLNN